MSSLAESQAAASGDVWDSVVGQQTAVSLLRGAAKNPVHAYLFVGRVGSGSRAAGRAFAAAILGEGLEGEALERSNRLALAEHHPALGVIERSGASISVDQADEIVRRASRSPAEGNRQVLMLSDFHLVSDAAPKLLKSIEEPPASTFFIILADDVSPELVTIASRCVRVDFPPLSTDEVAKGLVAKGVSEDEAQVVALASGGDLERAIALIDDDSLMERRSFWRGIPERIDGTGAMAATITKEAKGHIESALEAVAQAQEKEMAKAQDEAERLGQRASALKTLEARHKREQRRIRTDEIRAGIAQIADRYRESLTDSESASAYAAAGERIGQFADAMEFNPNEDLQLQALFATLPPLR